MAPITLLSLCAVVVIALLGHNLQADASDYHDAGLKMHNSYRKSHNSPAMKLNSNLNAIAAKCAKHNAKRGYIAHDCPFLAKGKQTDNLSISTKSSAKEAVQDSVKRWYDEVKKYNYRTGKFSLETGHFTQVVWKKSTNLGIGAVKGKWKGYDAYFVVAVYNPPGNTKGEFQKQVTPKSG